MSAVMSQLRPDRCEHTLPALRSMDVPTLSTALTHCDRGERRTIGGLLGTVLPPSGPIGDFRARLVRTGVLRASSTKTVVETLEVVADRLRRRSVEILGDEFDDPSRERVDALVAQLRDEFPDGLVRLYVALVIDTGAIAATHLGPYVAPGGPLAPLDVSPIDPAPAHTGRREPSEFSSARAQRRRHDRAAKAARREQQQAARRQRPRRRSRSATTNVDDGARTPITETPVEVTLTPLLHPHVTRFASVSADSPHRGMIGTAYIVYTGGDGKAGKVRPCVVVAAGKRHVVVRPLYSYARRPAGGWRAVELREWEAAGLEHPSWVGDETHKVRWNRFRPIGRLTVADWNLVCRGEVN